MGLTCSKDHGARDADPNRANEGGNSSSRGFKDTKENGTVSVMFRRIDVEKKGYISTRNFEQLLRDDKTHFHGEDAAHIMSKYGEDDRMNFDQFKTWWISAYSASYDDESDVLSKGDQESDTESQPNYLHQQHYLHRMEPIQEELTSDVVHGRS